MVRRHAERWVRDVKEAVLGLVVVDFADDDLRGRVGMIEAGRGGEVDVDGKYVAPTIVNNVTAEDALMSE